MFSVATHFTARDSFFDYTDEGVSEGFMRADPTWFEFEAPHSHLRAPRHRHDAPDHAAFNGCYLRADWTIGRFSEA